MVKGNNEISPSNVVMTRNASDITNIVGQTQDSKKITIGSSLPRKDLFSQLPNSGNLQPFQVQKEMTGIQTLFKDGKPTKDFVDIQNQARELQQLSKISIENDVLNNEKYNERFGTFELQEPPPKNATEEDKQKYKEEEKKYLENAGAYNKAINNEVDKNGALKLQNLSTWKGTSSQKMEDLAKFAEDSANAKNTVGSCYSGVADAFDEFIKRHGGQKLYGGSACMAAEQLRAQRNIMTEITKKFPTGESLRNLPRGALVVWDKLDPESPDGHISVALGNSMEASDHIAAQITKYRSQTAPLAVFIPKDVAA